MPNEFVVVDQTVAVLIVPVEHHFDVAVLEVEVVHPERFLELFKVNGLVPILVKVPKEPEQLNAPRLCLFLDFASENSFELLEISVTSERAADVICAAFLSLGKVRVSRGHTVRTTVYIVPESHRGVCTALAVVWEVCRQHVMQLVE